MGTRIKKTLFAVLMAVAPLQACDEAEPKRLPPAIQSFVNTHPNLKLYIKDIAAMPSWAQGKRWRASLADGQRIIIYEQAGVVTSIRRRDQSYLWKR